MIITQQKDKHKLLETLKGKAQKVYLVGCGECAAVCKTGGEPELDELAVFLEENGLEVVSKTVVPATCNEPGTGLKLRKDKDNKNIAEAFLVMSCGAGVQTITEQVNPDQQVYPGCDSLFLGNIKRINNYNQKCSTCGECVIGDFGGLCPVTRCPKGLLNGPCGGAINESCEVNHENPCIWIEIYNRLKTTDQLDNLKKVYKAKDNTHRSHPSKKIVKR